MTSRDRSQRSILRCHQVRVSERTIWTFVEINDGDFSGLGEATLEGRSDAVERAARSLGEALFEPGSRPSESHLERLAQWLRADRCAHSLVNATALSAIEQALHDLLARRAGLALHARLGQAQRSRIPLYANINRGTVPRTPERFAARALRAAGQGFNAIKMAPFDGVSPEADDAAAQRALVDAGLARIAAVRAALDAHFPDCALMVDCHWRFNAAQAMQMADELARLKVSWYECPVAEIPEQFDTLRQIRSRANDLGMQLAGAETMIGVNGFLPLLKAGLYDVVMPDVKYAGGLEETLRIAAACARHGTGCSPHNPSGPICHVHSVHVASVIPNMPLLEVQFEETPRFAEIVDASLPPFDGGATALPVGPGLGVKLI